MKQSIEVPGATLVNDITEIGGFESSNVQHNDSFTGEFNALASHESSLTISIHLQYEEFA